MKANKEGKSVPIGFLSATVSIFKWDLILITLLMLISEVSVWINILILKYLVDWIENDQNIWNGVILGFLFHATMLTAFIIRPFYFFYSCKLSILINKGISATLMKKMMSLSQKSLTFASSGKLVTLITSELHMIEKSFWFIPAIIVCPITLLA